MSLLISFNTLSIESIRKKNRQKNSQRKRFRPVTKCESNGTLSMAIRRTFSNCEWKKKTNEQTIAMGFAITKHIIIYLPWMLAAANINWILDIFFVVARSIHSFLSFRTTENISSFHWSICVAVSRKHSNRFNSHWQWYSKQSQCANYISKWWDRNENQFNKLTLIQCDFEMIPKSGVHFRRFRLLLPRVYILHTHTHSKLLTLFTVEKSSPRIRFHLEIV